MEQSLPSASLQSNRRDIRFSKWFDYNSVSAVTAACTVCGRAQRKERSHLVAGGDVSESEWMSTDCVSQ